MSLLNGLKPVSTDHSIKEAVISVFLSQAVQKPELFEELRKSEFSSFQRFESLSQVELDLSQGEAGNLNSPKVKVNDNTGFRFIRTTEGNLKAVLQCSNEQQRTFISFHTFEYVNWEPFISEFIRAIDVISSFRTDLSAIAFSLHYIDEFKWEGDLPIPVTAIFNQEADLLPRDFFSSANTLFALVTEKQVQEFTYFDRVELKVEPSPSPSITISHNVTQTLEEVTGLKHLIKEERFKRLLGLAHIHNKEMLKSLLTKEVQNLIHLK